MKRKEFVILPKHLIIGLLIFIAVAVSGYAFIPQAISRLTAPKPAQIAAQDGAQAFLSTDFEKGQSAWEESICKLASEESCAMLKKTIAPMLWPSVERSKLRQSCKARTSEMGQDNPATEETPHTQTWKVTLDCTDLQTNKTNTGEINVLVSEHTQGWKFERALFAQESKNVAP
jgi:hypothetical protein